MTDRQRGCVYQAGKNASYATLTKHDEEGLLEWSRHWGGRGDAGANAVTVDSSGDIIIMGHFSDDLQVGVTHLSSRGAVATYLSKLNSRGDVIWSVRVEGISPGKVTGYGIVVDGSDNIFVTGAFEGTLVYGTEQFASSGGQDVFVMKFDGGNGNTLWAMSAGGSGQDSGNSIAADKYGNLYVTGSFSDTAFFGTQALKSHGDLDVFWMKLGSK